MDKTKSPLTLPSPIRQSIRRRGGEKKQEVKPQTKEEAIRLIMSIGDEFGIAYMFFDTKEDAARLLSDMRLGHEIRRQLEAVGAEYKKEILQ